MKFGSFEVEVIDKEFYCRYCSEVSPRCLKTHRMGIWFFLRITNKIFNPKTVCCIIGTGEKEGGFPLNADAGKALRTGSSGYTEYERGYVTCGGWYSICTPMFLDKVPEDILEQEPVELSTTEQIVLSKLLNERKVQIIKGLIDMKILSLYDDWGIWNELKPLFFVYRRTNVYEYDDVEVVEIDKSWTSKVMYDKIEFFVPKGRLYYERKRLYNVLDVPNGEVYFYDKYGRKVVYYINKKSCRVLGWEQYHEHVHPRAELNIHPEVLESSVLYEIIKLLFTRRLGDIIFLKKGETELFGYLPPYPAEEEQFKKIECVEGTIEFGETIKIHGERIVLYHPEHGVLELPEGEYEAYSVPYLYRGHD